GSDPQRNPEPAALIGHSDKGVPGGIVCCSDRSARQHATSRVCDRTVHSRFPLRVSCYGQREDGGDHNQPSEHGGSHLKLLSRTLRPAEWQRARPTDKAPCARPVRTDAILRDLGRFEAASNVPYRMMASEVHYLMS